MTPERWRAAKELFDQLLTIPVNERHAWLDRAVEPEPELRQYVSALLEADESSKSFLDEPPLTGFCAAIEMRLREIPERIGPYRIQRELGRGGMGVVYLASRDDDAFERDVAIKLVRAGFDTALLLRFHGERQILARLDHPNIARLLDGGTTAQGCPYLVMDYAAGEPITSYCDRHRLPIQDRLRLFQAVCAAVHFAHGKQIIHRDLKPANILITQDGVPKLLDFGIAKLIVPDRAPSDMTLTSGAHPMTPGYASPEQLCGAPLTSASDTYSLAVILYELVCGTRPSPPTIPNAAPEPPSSRAYSRGDGAAVARGTTPGELRRALRGDIDNIALMGLHNEPDRRYATAAALADDIQRHLESIPVFARRDSLGYRTSRFLLRNRRLVVVAGVAMLALTAISGIAAWRDRRIIAQRNEAGQFGMSLLDRMYRNEKKNDAQHNKEKKNSARRTEEKKNKSRHTEEEKNDARPTGELHANLAWIYGYKGMSRMGRSPADYEKATRILEPLVAAGPSDPRTYRLQALTFERDAQEHANVDVASSLESHRRQVVAAESLARLRPNPPAQVYLATAVRSLGERLGNPYYGNAGNTAAARQEIERACRIAERWVPRLPPREGTWYIGYCYSTLAGVIWAEGDIDAAIALQQRAIAAFDDLSPGLPNWLELRAELGMIHVRLANFFHEARRHENAVDSVEEGIGMLDPGSNRIRTIPIYGVR